MEKEQRARDDFPKSRFLIGWPVDRPLSQRRRCEKRIAATRDHQMNQKKAAICGPLA
jgi:hypothetical protein